VWQEEEGRERGRSGFFWGGGRVFIVGVRSDECVGIRGHMGHIGILVVVVRRLSRRWKVKTLLAGPSPTSPMKAEITISPISNRMG